MPSSPILPPRFPPFPQGVRLPLVPGIFSAKKLSSRGKGKGRHSTRPPPHFPLEERVGRLLIFAQNHPRERTEQMNFSHETSFFAIPVDISPSEIFPLFSTPRSLSFRIISAWRGMGRRRKRGTAASKETERDSHAERGRKATHEGGEKRRRGKG